MRTDVPGSASSPVPAPATLELVAWVAARPRTYGETIDAWRSNCPRLSAWDDALAAGLVRVGRSPGRRAQAPVMLTPAGAATLD